jgi:hypothetical protein
LAVVPQAAKMQRMCIVVHLSSSTAGGSHSSKPCVSSIKPLLSIELQSRRSPREVPAGFGSANAYSSGNKRGRKLKVKNDLHSLLFSTVPEYYRPGWQDGSIDRLS